MNDHIRDANALREQLITTVLFRVESEVKKIILPNTPSNIRAAIREEVLPNCRFQLNHLTVDELVDQRLVERHVGDAIATTQYLVNRFKAVSNGPTPSTQQACLDCGGTGAFDLWSGEPCECCDGTGIFQA
jgi:hypothetical protein